VGTLRWTDLRGKEQTRETNRTININDFKGLPGYPLLVLAANRHLSGGVLEALLELAGGKNLRSRSWIYRRRWLFLDPETAQGSGPQPNADGRDPRAVAIMRENPTLSLRDLSRLLAQHGIKRGKDWVRQHRCD
jgi:hypothetical protein